MVEIKFYHAFLEKSVLCRGVTTWYNYICLRTKGRIPPLLREPDKIQSSVPEQKEGENGVQKFGAIYPGINPYKATRCRVQKHFFSLISVSDKF